MCGFLNYTFSHDQQRVQMACRSGFTAAARLEPGAPFVGLLRWICNGSGRYFILLQHSAPHDFRGPQLRDGKVQQAEERCGVWGWAGLPLLCLDPDWPPPGCGPAGPAVGLHVLPQPARTGSRALSGSLLLEVVVSPVWRVLVCWDCSTDVISETLDTF